MDTENTNAAETAPETATEALEAPTEAPAEPRDSDDIWNSDAISFDKGRVDDEEKDPSAPVPSDEEAAVSQGKDDGKDDLDSDSDDAQDAESDDEDDPADDTDESDDSDVKAKDEDEADDSTAEKFTTKFSRKRLRQIENELLVPFTDPDTPIEKVFEAFHKFDPMRSEQLFKTVIDKSVEQFPEQWLKAVTGLDVSIDEVKAKFSETTEQANERPDLTAAMERLNEFYGEKWRDAANDDDLVEDDLVLARLLRNIDGTTSEKDAKIRELEEKLSALEPEIKEVKTRQEQEREQRYQETLQKSVDEYKAKVEGAALPKLFEQKGLTPTPDDSESIKALKESVKGLFESKYGLESEFDRFVSYEYEGREQMQKVVQRVSKYLDEAAKAESLGDKEKASALRAQAADDQDTLTVIARKAANAFLDNSFAAKAMNVLAENADLQRRLNQTSGRKEVVGNTAKTAGQPWRDKLKSDPWSDDVLSERLQSVHR